MMSFQYCQDHQNQTLTSICIAKHDCNVKICAKCQYLTHKEIPQSQMIPFDIFKQNTLQEVQKNLKELSNITKSKSKEYFKQLVDQIEKQFKKFIEDVKDSIQNTFNTLQEEDKNYQNLEKQIIQYSLAEFSKNELRQIIQLSEVGLVHKRQDNIKNLEQQVENISKIFQKFEKDINEYLEQSYKSTMKQTNYANKYQMFSPQQASRMNKNRSFIYKQLQLLINLIYFFQALKEYFRDDPKNPIIETTLNKIIIELNIINTTLIDLELNIDSVCKQDLINQKHNAGSMFIEIFKGLKENIKVELSQYSKFYLESLNDPNKKPQLPLKDLNIQANFDQNIVNNMFDRMQITDQQILETKQYQYVEIPKIDQLTQNAQMYSQQVIQQISQKSIQNSSLKKKNSKW